MERLERLVSSSASFSVLVSQPQIPSLMSWKGMCISSCSICYSFFKKIITQLSPGGLADADWLFKLLPLYWSPVWRFQQVYSPKGKAFCVRWASEGWVQKMTGKGGFSGVKLCLVWNILGSEGLRALVEWEWSAVCFLSCPQLANVWWGRGDPCPMDHSNSLNLMIKCRLTFLQNLYCCKLRPQCLHFENVESRLLILMLREWIKLTLKQCCCEIPAV